MLYRVKDRGLEVFLVHPGGPFYKNKDAGVWSIPKGEIDENEDPQKAARREFFEETGCVVSGNLVPLNPVVYRGNKKTVHAWAIEGDVDVNLVRSNTFLLEWPPRSGKKIEVAEVDAAAWFSVEEAGAKILPSLLPLIQDLVGRLGT